MPELVEHSELRPAYSNVFDSLARSDAELSSYGSLGSFLDECREHAVDPVNPGEDGGADGAAGVFLRAGLAALSARDDGWTQFGLCPSDGNYAALCRRLSVLARDLLGTDSISGFFYLNKPPGLRVRFRRGTAASARELAAHLQTTFEDWGSSGLISKPSSGVYEPEAALFGGSISMDFVHRVWLHDSLLWLDHHGALPSEPRWALSLAVLRHTYELVGISAWEDLGVWDTILRRGGRGVDAAQARPLLDSSTVPVLRAAWEDLRVVRAQLCMADQELLGTYVAQSRPVLSEWLDTYFRSASASVGPRHCAAFLTIHHWNRGCLPFAWQSVIATALATRLSEAP